MVCLGFWGFFLVVLYSACQLIFPVVCNIQKAVGKGCFSFCQNRFLLSIEIIKTGSSLLLGNQKSKEGDRLPRTCVKAGVVLQVLNVQLELRGKLQCKAG